MDKGVVFLAQADEVAELGLAAVGPVDDVVGVGAAGVAAGELAAVAVAFADGPAERGRGLASAAADVENGAGSVVIMVLMVALQLMSARVLRLRARPSWMWQRIGWAGCETGRVPAAPSGVSAGTSSVASSPLMAWTPA